MSKNQKSRLPVCGNCEHFVAGGLCELVKGNITSKAICKFHAFGRPVPIDTKIAPKFDKKEAKYKTGLTETISGELVQKALQMEHELMARGIPEEEVHRAVIAYFSGPEPPPAMPWPGPVTGLDLAGRIEPFKVPDTGEPLTDFRGLPPDVQPYPTPNKSPYGIGGGPQPYPSNPTPDPNSLGSLSNTYNVLNHPYPYDSPVWDGLASDVNSEPSMHGEYGFNVAKAIPEWRYDIEQSQTYPLKIPDIIIPPSGAIMEAEKKLARYVYQGHDSNDICSGYDGKTFDLNDTSNRPVPPSEGLGYTTTHPNCNCYWEEQKDVGDTPDSLNRIEQNDIDDIKNHISSAAKKGELHTVKTDGKLSQKTRKTNPMKEPQRRQLRESIINLRQEFNWLTEDYIESAKKLADESGGVLYLVRAAGETITDHRGEGEPYKRKLSAQELNDMTRTIIGKSMDINHQPEYQTDAIILDADFDKKRREMQTLVLETDDEIIKAIDTGKITAVSINGGMPRSESVEPCNHGCTIGDCELCLVPKGVVLGELDGIGMTYVVTDPNGLYWDGHFIPKAEPGVKFTKIEAL